MIVSKIFVSLRLRRYKKQGVHPNFKVPCMHQIEYEFNTYFPCSNIHRLFSLLVKWKKK